MLITITAQFAHRKQEYAKIAAVTVCGQPLPVNAANAPGNLIGGAYVFT